VARTEAREADRWERADAELTFTQNHNQGRKR
jgi:hypothetical protein